MHTTKKTTRPSIEALEQRSLMASNVMPDAVLSNLRAAAPAIVSHAPLSATIAGAVYQGSVVNMALLQSGTTIDLKSTVGKAFEAAMRAVLPGQFSFNVGFIQIQGSLKRASCDRLDFDTRSQLLRGDFTISYQGTGKVAGLKAFSWSATTAIHVTIDVTNPLNSRYVIDVGKFTGVIDSDKIRAFFRGLYNRVVDAFKGLSGESLQKVTLREKAIDSPSMIVFKNQRFLFWAGTDRDHRINMMSSALDGAWGNKHTLAESSRHGMALAVFNNRLYVAWSDMNDHRLRVKSFDGANWSATAVLGETTSVRPALVVHDKKLVLAWTGSNSSANLNLLVSSDGRKWEGKRTLKDRASDGPALASHMGRLFLAWTGTNFGRNLNVMSTADLGASWQNKRVLGDSSWGGPSLVSDGAKLHLGWSGLDSQRRLNVRRSSDGLTFGNKRTWADGSESTPCLAIVSSKLQVAWTDRQYNVTVGAEAPPIYGTITQAAKWSQPSLLDQVFTTMKRKDVGPIIG